MNAIKALGISLTIGFATLIAMFLLEVDKDTARILVYVSFAISYIYFYLRFRKKSS